jgi:hypothetical protein
VGVRSESLFEGWCCRHGFYLPFPFKSVEQGIFTDLRLK